MTHTIAHTQGITCSLTDSLSLLIPNNKEKAVSFIAEEKLSLPQKELIDWLHKQPISHHITLHFHGPLSKEEITYLCKIQRYTKMLIIDTPAHYPELLKQEWPIATAKTLSDSLNIPIGIRLIINEHTSIPWILNTSIRSGAHVILLDGQDQTISALRETQDYLEQHLLAKGSAKLAPILKPSQFKVDEFVLDLFDFDELDRLVIESNRNFWAGAVIEDSNPTFGPKYSLFIQKLLEEQRSSCSLLNSWQELPPNAQKLIKALYKLAQTIHSEQISLLPHTMNSLESIWHEYAHIHKSYSTLSMLIHRLCEHTRTILSQIPNTRRSSQRSSFSRSKFSFLPRH